MNVNYVFFMVCCPWLSVALDGSNRCSEEDVKRCTADEFLDISICMCSSCADFCQLRPNSTRDSFCRLHCPDYYYKRTNSTRHGLGAKESGVGSTSIALLPVQEDNALVKKPLFWTSVVSVFISVVATVILVVLCTCKKSRPVLALHQIRRMQLSQTRKPAQGANEKGESSTGMLRTSEEANDPLLQSSAKNFSKEKCGETFAPLVSHRMTMDSCAVVHETVISHCESSRLHKPCVASFKDSGFLVNNENLCIFSMDDYDKTSTNASTTATTTTSTSMILTTTKNAVICTDTSMPTSDSRRPENLDSSLYDQGLEKPSEAIERCAFDSGYFNSSSCTEATTWGEESPVDCTVYTVSVASGIATDKEVETPSSYPVQETHTWTDEGNNAADWKCYREISPASFYGTESKAPINQCDQGVKPSLLTSLHRISYSTHDESALQESTEETGLKNMQPDTNCTLNYMPEYVYSASHTELSSDRYIHTNDQSFHELEKFGNVKQVAELNLNIRSTADTTATKSEPCIVNLEVRDLTKYEEDSNEEDTTVKMQKLNTYGKSSESLFDVNCVLYG